MKLRLFRPALALVALPALVLLTIAEPAAAALPPASGAPANQATAQLLADAQKALKAGNLPLAIIHYKNASSADPRNGQVRAQLGILLYRTGDYYAAERELRQARKDGGSDQVILPTLFQTMLARNEEKALLLEFVEPMTPSNMAPEILNARALAFLKLGQTAEAIDAADKSLKLRRDANGLFMRARIARETGSPAAAMQFTNEAIAKAPDNINGYLLRIDLLREAGDMNGALALADELLTKFPGNRVAQFSRVDLLIRLRKYDLAKVAVDQALAKIPQYPLAVYYQAVLLQRTGDTKGAWRIAQALPQEFLRQQPSIAITVAGLAEGAGNSDTAFAILNSALSRFPQDAQLRLQLARMHLKQKDMKGALSVLETVRGNPDPAIVQMLAALYVSNGRSADALAALQKLAQSGKGTDATTLQLVALEQQMGQADQALKDLTAAVQAKPANPLLAEQLVVALIARGRSAEALSVADKLGADPAQKVTSLVLRGQVFMADRKPDLALASYNRALQTDGKSQIALYGRAVLLESMQKFDGATQDLQAILKVNPRHGPAYLKLAEIAARQKQDAQVRAVLAQAISQMPEQVAPRLALIRYLAGRNDRAGALAAVNGLLKVQPNNMEGLAALGAIQLSGGQKANAVATFRRMVTLNPQSSGPQMLLANALYLNGDKAGANAAMKSAVALSPASAEARSAQITMMLADKNIDGAIGAAQAYQSANPGIQADILMGDTLARAGRRDQALAVYKKTFAAKPSGDVLLRIVRNQVVSGDLRSASEALSGWVEKNPQDTLAKLEYASILMQMKNNGDAIRLFREVLKKAPNNVVALNNLAWLTQDKDPSGATALAERALALAPNSADVLDTLGWIKLKHGKASESVALFKRAHDLRPGDGEISYHVALSLEATGQRNAARDSLNALLRSQVKFTGRDEAAKLIETWR